MEEIISYLEDAACRPDLISEICRLYENGNEEVVIQKLRRHRCVLMDELHASQRKVDCLDLLLRRMTKSKTQRHEMEGK